MIRVCAHCDEIYGEKEPLEDKSYTHGICIKCLEIELKKLGRTLEKFEEFKKRRLTNMPREGNGHIRIRPKKGDFVLAFDDIWIVQKIKGKIAYIEGVGSGEYEEVFIDSFEFTPIQTWEVA